MKDPDTQHDIDRADEVIAAAGDDLEARYGKAMELIEGQRLEIDTLKSKLAELIKSVNECDRDHDLPPLTADFGKGWFSPDEAAKLQAQCAAMRDFIEKTPHKAQCQLNKSRPFSDKLRKQFDAKGCDCGKDSALSTTAGADLLDNYNEAVAILEIIQRHLAVEWAARGAASRRIEQVLRKHGGAK